MGEDDGAQARPGSAPGSRPQPATAHPAPIAPPSPLWPATALGRAAISTVGGEFGPPPIGTTLDESHIAELHERAWWRQ